MVQREGKKKEDEIVLQVILSLSKPFYKTIDALLTTDGIEHQIRWTTVEWKKGFFVLLFYENKNAR